VLGAVKAAAWKRRRCLTGRVPAGLDAPCARRLQDLAVGMEECSQRGSNQRMGDLEEDEEARRGVRSARHSACVPHVTTDHPCALIGSTRLSAGGFVLVSVKANVIHSAVQTVTNDQMARKCVNLGVSAPYALAGSNANPHLTRAAANNSVSAQMQASARSTESHLVGAEICSQRAELIL
jgi:hypothetical protein